MSGTVYVVTETVHYEGTDVKSIHDSRAGAKAKVDELAEAHRYEGWECTEDSEDAYRLLATDVVLTTERMEVLP